MNEAEKRHRIARAKEVLREIHHIPVATVNPDGSPLASPVFLAFDVTLHGFWSSSPLSLHSQNIARDPRVFLVIFDSKDGHSGLFLSGTARELNTTEEVTRGLAVIRELKQRLYGDMGEASMYSDGGAQRIYEFTPEHTWVNHSEKQHGVIVRDRRYEIAIAELVTR